MRYIFVSIAILLLLSGCADSVRFTLSEDLPEVGFWYGLWHGAISGVAFIISLFDDSVSVYALYNNGGWYDFGFLLGITSVWGGSCHQMRCKIKTDKDIKKEKEWEEIGSKVEAKIMTNLKEWVKDENTPTEDVEWKDVGDKVEAKIKRILREWAEEDRPTKSKDK